jgi:hypothetical protein
MNVKSLHYKQITIIYGVKQITGLKQKQCYRGKMKREKKNTL